MHSIEWAFVKNTDAFFVFYPFKKNKKNGEVSLIIRFKRAFVRFLSSFSPVLAQLF